MDNQESFPKSTSLENARLLCVFAHPDDEVFCSGGTIAKYAAAGVEVMVVSATKGDAGQIRDANVATRRTLGKVREQELNESCKRLGAHHAVCLDYGDGTLKDISLDILTGHIVEIIRQYQPNVVITFGPDGAYGHPDHVAIGEAATIACSISGDPHQFPVQIVDGLKPYAPERLYHSHFPRSRMLMLDKLSHWLVEKGGAEGQTANTSDFVRALLLFAEETTLLNYSSDRLDVNWYPTGFYIIEQGETAKDLYLILSGSATVAHEEADGSVNIVNRLGPGSFFGERGLATHQKRNAHVIAQEDVTCLVLSMTEAITYAGRGSEATITGGSDVLITEELSDILTENKNVTACIDVSQFVYQKVSAMAAHRTQYPISPDMFPLDMLTEMMGREYFVRILPRPKIEETLFPDE